MSRTHGWMRVSRIAMAALTCVAGATMFAASPVHANTVIRECITNDTFVFTPQVNGNQAVQTGTIAGSYKALCDYVDATTGQISNQTPYSGVVNYQYTGNCDALQLTWSGGTGVGALVSSGVDTVFNGTLSTGNRTLNSTKVFTSGYCNTASISGTGVTVDSGL